jgi:hypothetical protein
MLSQKIYYNHSCCISMRPPPSVLFFASDFSTNTMPASKIVAGIFVGKNNNSGISSKSFRKPSRGFRMFYTSFRMLSGSFRTSSESFRTSSGSSRTSSGSLRTHSGSSGRSSYKYVNQ